MLGLDVDDLNRLEQAFVVALNYGLSVTPSEYARYYFALRSICHDQARTTNYGHSVLYFLYSLPPPCFPTDVRSCLPASAYHEQDTKLRPLDDALAARLQRRGGPAALIAARWAAEDGLVNSDTLSAHPRAEDGAHALRRSV